MAHCGISSRLQINGPEAPDEGPVRAAAEGATEATIRAAAEVSGQEAGEERLQEAENAEAANPRLRAPPPQGLRDEIHL